MTTTHLRTQIRDAMATAVTSLATTGTRVHKSRMYPAADAGLPCLLVFCGDQERIEQDATNIQQRTLEMTVRGLVKATGDIDASLNQIALEVEAAVQSAGTLSSKVSGVTLTGIDSTLDDSLEKPVGIIDLSYRITYFTIAGAPGVNV